MAMAPPYDAATEDISPLLEDQSFLLGEQDEKRSLHRRTESQKSISDIRWANRPARDARPLVVVYSFLSKYFPCLPQPRGNIRDWNVFHPLTILCCLRAVAIFLLPSFVRRFFLPTELERNEKVKVHPTGFLDGLRGCAAFAVFIYHFSVQIYARLMCTYGGPKTDKYGPNDQLIQLPIVKLIYAGPAAVCVFFVVSGYALSVRPVAQMRSHEDSRLMVTLSSSVFRRAMRLFLPCVFSTFIAFVFVRMGVFDLTAFVHNNKKWMAGRPKSHQQMEGSFTDQFSDWAYRVVTMIRPFQWVNGRFQMFNNSYDPHLWTIAIEFRASLTLFITQMGVARLKPTMRMLVTALLVAYAVNIYRWEMALFWSGAILAELHMGYLNPNKLRERRLRFRILWWLMFLGVLFLGLFLTSYPDRFGRRSPGYRYLTRMIPEQWLDKRRFWQGWGAVLLVLGIQSLPPIARFMGRGIPRYLGQISFALYLMHGLCNRTIGYTSLYFAWKITGRATDKRIFLGYLLAISVHVPITIWVADIFWRTFDLPTIKFAKWFEEICLRKPKTAERTGILSNPS